MIEWRWRVSQFFCGVRISYKQAPSLLLRQSRQHTQAKASSWSPASTRAIMDDLSLEKALLLEVRAGAPVRSKQMLLTEKKTFPSAGKNRSRRARLSPLGGWVNVRPSTHALGAYACVCRCVCINNESALSVHSLHYFTLTTPTTTTTPSHPSSQVSKGDVQSDAFATACGVEAKKVIGLIKSLEALGVEMVTSAAKDHAKIALMPEAGRCTSCICTSCMHSIDPPPSLTQPGFPSCAQKSGVLVSHAFAFRVQLVPLTARRRRTSLRGRQRRKRSPPCPRRDARW
jgi:hypothetical protein